eukprot:427973-Pleurochrysis_carterae.AAC.1
MTTAECSGLASSATDFVSHAQSAGRDHSSRSWRSSSQRPRLIAASGVGGIGVGGIGVGGVGVGGVGVEVGVGSDGGRGLGGGGSGGREHVSAPL